MEEKSKYVLSAVCTEDMDIYVTQYDTYMEAYEAMVEEVNSVPSEEVIDCSIYKFSAYVIGDYEYSWSIKKVTF
jgi:hypothetical protein